MVCLTVNIQWKLENVCDLLVEFEESYRKFDSDERKVVCIWPFVLPLHMDCIFGRRVVTVVDGKI